MKKIIALSVSLLLLCACHNKNDIPVPNPAPAVYFWRTAFALDTTEQTFITRHSIRKIYLRFFDVVLGKDNVPVPNGTVSFVSKAPQGVRIIPVVYIDRPCLIHTDNLAEKIVKRVTAMAEANDIHIDELQIDCDWTSSTQSAFYQLLSNIHRLLNEQGKYMLSATIRLHQLNMTPPPVDYGVLMCYNTGNLRDYNCRNSILDARDVQPFVKYLSHYSLALCAAYPIFSWKLLFEEKEFKAILREANLRDANYYKKENDSRYTVVRTHSVPSPDAESFGMMVRAGDEVKCDTVSSATLLNVQRILEKERPSINKQTIIYSLNTTDIKTYSDYEMVKIIHH
jgi:hypothetical protein